MTRVSTGSGKRRNLFFSSEGRLNRAPFNIILILVVLTSLPILVLFPYFGLWTLIKLLGLAVTLYPTIQRLHDRGYSGWWYAYMLFALIGATLVTFLSSSVVYARLLEEGDSATERLSTSLLSFLSTAGTFVYVVIMGWFLAQLCFFRGTEGPNAYGPDPLEASSSSFCRRSILKRVRSLRLKS